MKKKILLSLMFGSALFANQDNNLTVAFDEKFDSQTNQEEQDKMLDERIIQIMDHGHLAELEDFVNKYGDRAIERLKKCRKSVDNSELFIEHGRYGYENIFHMLARNKAGHGMFDYLVKIIGDKDARDMLDTQVTIDTDPKRHYYMEYAYKTYFDVYKDFFPSDIAAQNYNHYLERSINDFMYGDTYVWFLDKCYALREVHSLVRLINNPNITDEERNNYRNSLEAYKDLAIHLINKYDVVYDEVDSDGYSISQLIVATGCADLVDAFIKRSDILKKDYRKCSPFLFYRGYKAGKQGRNDMSMADIIKISSDGCDPNEIQRIREMLEKKDWLGEEHENLDGDITPVFNKWNRLQNNTNELVKECMKLKELCKSGGSDRDDEINRINIRFNICKLLLDGVRDQVTIDGKTYPTAFVIVDTYDPQLIYQIEGNKIEEYMEQDGFFVKKSDDVVKCCNDRLDDTDNILARVAKSIYDDRYNDSYGDTRSKFLTFIALIDMLQFNDLPIDIRKRYLSSYINFDNDIALEGKRFVIKWENGKLVFRDKN